MRPWEALALLAGQGGRLAHGHGPWHSAHGGHRLHCRRSVGRGENQQPGLLLPEPTQNAAPQQETQPPRGPQPFQCLWLVRAEAEAPLPSPPLAYCSRKPSLPSPRGSCHTHRDMALEKKEVGCFHQQTQSRGQGASSVRAPPPCTVNSMTISSISLRSFRATTSQR